MRFYKAEKPMNPKERVWPAIMIVPTTDAVEPLALALDKRLGSLNLIDQAEPYASLRSTGITPLLRYYGRSDSCPGGSSYPTQAQ